MTFDCGHNALQGVRQKYGTVCSVCHFNGFTLPKPRKKMGRPVTKTPDERRKKEKQWFADNADERREYLKKYMQEKRAANRVKCVVKLGHKYKSCGNGKWGTRSQAKVYSSEARAKMAVQMIGIGKVIRLED